MGAHIPSHWDSKTKKPQHQDSRTKKPQHWDSGTKAPQHQETETNKPQHHDSKVFFKSTKSHNIEIPRPKNHNIEIPRPKSQNIEFLRNSNPYAPWYAKHRGRKSFDTWYHIVTCAMLCVSFSSKKIYDFPKHILKSKSRDLSNQAKKKWFCHVIVNNYLSNVSWKFWIKITSMWRCEFNEQPRCLYFPIPSPQFVFTGAGLNLYLPALAPNLYLPALACNFITSLRLGFACNNLISSICICIYGPGLRFALPVWFLVDVYLNIGSRSTDSSNSSSSNLFGTNNTNICMPMLVT